MSDTRVPPAATDLIPPEQWIEIVGAIGYDESADPAIFTAIERGARLAVANEVERIAEALRTGGQISDLIGTAIEASGIRNELLARARELRGEG